MFYVLCHLFYLSLDPYKSTLKTCESDLFSKLLKSFLIHTKYVSSFLVLPKSKGFLYWPLILYNLWSFNTPFYERLKVFFQISVSWMFNSCSHLISEKVYTFKSFDTKGRSKRVLLHEVVLVPLLFLVSPRISLWLCFRSFRRVPATTFV